MNQNYYYVESLLQFFHILSKCLGKYTLNVNTSDKNNEILFNFIKIIQIIGNIIYLKVIDYIIRVVCVLFWYVIVKYLLLGVNMLKIKDTCNSFKFNK